MLFETCHIIAMTVIDEKSRESDTRSPRGMRGDHDGPQYSAESALSWPGLGRDPLSVKVASSMMAHLLRFTRVRVLIDAEVTCVSPWSTT